MPTDKDKCPTCEGKGWVSPVPGYRSGCIDCDGTGKASTPPPLGSLAEEMDIEHLISDE